MQVTEKEVLERASRVLRFQDIEDGELALLVALLRMPLSPARAARTLRLHRAEIDWERLLQLAVTHRVSPLLYGVLREGGGAPPEFIARLGDRCTKNAARSLQLTSELLNVVRCLEGEGIPVVPFKGPMASLFAYGSLGLREFGDLDVLIHLEQFPQAIGALKRTGYTVDPKLGSLEKHLSRMHEVRLIKPTAGQPTLLELHWRLAPSFWHVPLTSEELIAQSTPASLLDGEIRVLPPDMQFLIGCMSGAKTCFQYMDSVCQLAAMVSRKEIGDWPRLDQQAAALGLSRSLHLAVELSSIMLGADDTARITSLIRGDRTVPGLARRVLDRWSNPWRENRTYEWTSFQLRVRERLRDRLPYIKNRLMTLGRPGRPISASFGFLDLVCLPISLVRGTWLFLRVMADRRGFV